MKYRGKDPRATVTGGGSKSTGGSSKSKYRGAPVSGSAGYYKGRGYERPAAPAPTTTGTTARPMMGSAGGATGVPRGGRTGGATNARAMLRDQVSQLRQQQLRDQLRYLRQQGLIDV